MTHKASTPRTLPSIFRRFPPVVASFIVISPHLPATFFRYVLSSSARSERQRPYTFFLPGRTPQGATPDRTRLWFIDERLESFLFFVSPRQFSASPSGDASSLALGAVQMACLQPFFLSQRLTKIIPSSLMKSQVDARWLPFFLLELFPSTMVPSPATRDIGTVVPPGHLLFVFLLWLCGRRIPQPNDSFFSSCWISQCLVGKLLELFETRPKNKEFFSDAKASPFPTGRLVFFFSTFFSPLVPVP